MLLSTSQQISVVEDLSRTPVYLNVFFSLVSSFLMFYCPVKFPKNFTSHLCRRIGKVTLRYNGYASSKVKLSLDRRTITCRKSSLLQKQACKRMIVKDITKGGRKVLCYLLFESITNVRLVHNIMHNINILCVQLQVKPAANLDPCLSSSNEVANKLKSYVLGEGNPLDGFLNKGVLSQAAQLSLSVLKSANERNDCGKTLDPGVKMLVRSPL